MARGKWKIYKDFRNFDKTYKTYVNKYYSKARSIYRKLSGAKTTRGMSKEELQDYMYDSSGPLNRKQFAAEYRAYKRELISSDSSADPTQYIVRDQAYKYSEAQYRAFTKAVKNDEFGNFRGISREEFRTGGFRSNEFRAYLKEMYKKRKDQLREMGIDERDIIAQASQEFSAYFGS